MKINRIHKTADRAPQFPCYLWHAEERCYIFAYTSEVFLDGWESIYPYWHEGQPEWPTDEPTANE